MKKIAIIIVSLLASTLVTAQSGKKSHGGHKDQDLSIDEKAKKESQRVSEKLGLTVDQQIQWEQAARERLAANEPYRAKMEGSTTPEERQQLKVSMQSNKQAFDKKTESFLTAEQKVKYEEMKKQQRQKRKHWHKNKGAETK